MKQEEQHTDQQDLYSDQKAPLFRSWNGWYIALISFLLLEIILFVIITQHFS
ncbi:MAG: hypothetical protein ACO29O_08065 [Chitinophagaceae bacterium]